MGVLKNATRGVALGCFVIAGSGAAFAGGWSTEGIAEYDLLFADERFALEVQKSYAWRNVDFKNSRTTQTEEPENTTNSSASDIAPDLDIYAGSVKFKLLENIDFFARINQPYSINEVPGADWNGRFAIVDTKADGVGFDAMLSYKYEVSAGSFMRVFGGFRSGNVNYEQQSLTLIPFGTPPPEIVTDLKLESERKYGYRIGATFEKPEIALRALIAYESAIDLDLDGTLDLVGFREPFAASAKASLPQSLEAKIQTGIAPKWLATFGVKWTDWSVLDALSVDVVGDGFLIPSNIVRDLGYSDGWIVEAGVGHQLTDKLSLGSSVSWDKGIGGPYSDTYSLSLGGSYDLHENVKFTLGGRAIYKMAGEGAYTIDKFGSALGDTTTNTDYDYDSSWNYAITSKLRLSF